MKTLYVTDMDGTLLNNGSFVSPESSRIISDLTRRGALITVATARTPATVVPLMEGTDTRVPYIVMTGAAMFDPHSMSYCADRLIAPSKASRAFELFKQYGVHPFVYHFVGADRRLFVYHNPTLTKAERSFYEARANLKLKHFTFEPRSDWNSDVILFFGIGPTATIQPLADAIEATGEYSFSCYPDIFLTDVSLIEVFARGVSKASAIRMLADTLKSDRVVVFGDNLNDLPMFAEADLAVAVANALPAVREAADIVIGPNFDNSVARFIAQDYDNTAI